MDFSFEKISSDEFEERKNNGEFGEILKAMVDDEKDNGINENEIDFKEYSGAMEKNLIKATYELPKRIKFALKRKSANEDKKINEIVAQILENGIEEKYFRSY